MITYTKTTCLLGSGLLALALGMAPVHASRPDAAQSIKSTQTSQLDGARFLKEAKVTLAGARAIALKACNGKIIAQELEKEHGGSGLRYSFDIRHSGAVHEVGVDAKSGKVLENSVESGEDDKD
ncbi:MAG TPA: PepSY domain-containing protein [Oleiagrimonas sp.]|nr:PepSY domain-containing protein [Oleiagrimonas sp.]